MNSKTLNLMKSIGVMLAIGSAPLTFLHNAHAVSPAPDGGYAGGNTAEGTQALQSLTTGTYNTALGQQALFHETSGSSNNADGFRALFSNTTGGFNTASGVNALFSNVTGSNNTATGYAALYRNTASYNTATGWGALYSNTSGFNNTANGNYALYFNTTGFSNTANGNVALYSNTTGGANTADGEDALRHNTTGHNNIALGISAGANLTTGDNNIDIGNSGVAAESDTIRIGSAQTKTFVAGINGANEGGTISAVYINGNGRLGTQPPPSSRRFKKEIRPMDHASEAILGLKPVTFHYKSDSNGAPQFGLIAEEVAKVNSDLVVRDADGEIYTVRYDAVNAMLLNEFLKEHRKVEELERKLDTVVARLKQQESKIQNVSTKLEGNRPARQLVLNDR